MMSRNHRKVRVQMFEVDSFFLGYVFDSRLQQIREPRTRILALVEFQKREICSVWVLISAFPSFASGCHLLK